MSSSRNSPPLVSLSIFPFISLRSILTYLRSIGERVSAARGIRFIRRTLPFCLPGLAVLAAVASHAESLRGVVVTDIAPYSEASRSGIKPGDVVLGWMRGDVGGSIESPFELVRAEIEQAPLGTVTVYGLSGSEERSWMLAQGDWGLKTRPNFSAANLKLYRNGKALVRSGTLRDAYAAWQLIASNTAPRSPWVYAWCATDVAEFMARQKRWRSADLLYQEAIRNTKKDLSSQVFVIRSWVPGFEERADWETVTRLLKRALTDTESVSGEGLFTASALSQLALVTEWRRDLTKAAQLYAHALSIDQKLVPSSLATARILVMLARLSLNGGDLASAHAYLRKAKPIIDQSSPEGYDAARFLIMTGNVTRDEGDLDGAKKYFTQARDLLESHWADSLTLAGDLNQLAFVLVQQGDLLAADVQLLQAAQIYQKHPADPTVGYALSNQQGLLANSRGDFVTGEKYSRQTEAILAKLAPHSRDYAGCLLNAGLSAFGNDDFRAADSYWLRGLTIINQVAPFSVERADLLLALGWAALHRGDLRKAFEYTSGAQALLKKLDPRGPDMADVLRTLGDISRQRGKPEEAELYFRQSLATEQIVEPASADYAETLSDLAQVFEEQHRSELATQELEKAINVLEGAMGRLGGNEAVRSDFRERHEVIYKRYIDVLLQQGRVDEAFDVSERSRARTLLEMLAQAHIHVRQHIAASFRDEDQSLREQFARESDHRLRLLAGPHTDEQIASSDAKMSKLLERFSGLESRIRDTSPSYAELTQPSTTTLKDVQDRLLDPDTLLLEYSMGEPHSYLWLISSESASIHVLPGRREIDTQARRAYRELSASGDSSGSIGQGKPQISSSLALKGLSRMVLGPIERELGHKRLLIVADGALNYIPFAALPLSGEPGGAVSELIAQHEIVSLPSASVLMTLRQERIGFQPPPRAVAVMADPVFDSQDPRVKLSGRSSVPHPSAINGGSFLAVRSGELTRTRWSKALGLDPRQTIHFPRLIYSRHEAQAIMAAIPASESLEALDFKASRSLAMSTDLAQYKILHFATHGLIDTTHPEFSGLLFSLYDEGGAPQIGLLSLEDIYNLNLPVDLVVLSACETALGREVNGEGLIGLTRGFMYAGAARVLASLWRVNDVATAQLMANFYRSMEKDHLTPAAALRKAQLQLRQDKRWAAPYYWAGFELQGEWR